MQCSEVEIQNSIALQLIVMLLCRTIIIIIITVKCKLSREMFNCGSGCVQTNKKNIVGLHTE